METATTSRVASRLLHQAHVAGAGTSVVSEASPAAVSGNIFAQASTYVTSSFAGASFMNQLVVLIVLGLSALMVIFLGVMWTAEIMGVWHSRPGKSKVKQQQSDGYSTPTATSLSLPDLESPTKQQDDAVLAEISTFNKGVQMIINESTDYGRSDVDAASSGYRREARRQLNLKLKASPSLDRVGGFGQQTSAKFSPRDPTLRSMAIMRKWSNTNTSLDTVTRKETFGANEHTRIVRPLTMTDLTVVESVRGRDISKAGWSHDPRSDVNRRNTVASSPGVSPRDDFSPIGAIHELGNMNACASVDAPVDPVEKVAVHNSITQSTMPTLHSALSIGPMDAAGLSSPNQPRSNGTHNINPLSGHKDRRLNDSIVLLDQDQFQNEIVLIKLIGTGACGSVHEAIWRGSLCAVKILHPSKQISQTTVNTFRREVEFMSTIGDHRGVLKILAACLSPPNLCIITELATNGSLHAIIHDRHLRPEYSTLLDLSIQIADAITFCHAKNLVHRDLKTHNILLGEDNNVLVADFGLAMDMDEKTMADCSGQSTLMGTSAYMSPEQFSGTKIDEKCDSYAFGCILWECITGVMPWSECNNVMQIVMAVGLERKRPPLPKGVPPPIAAIIRECWRHNSRLRPSMSEVADRLRSLKREEQERSTFKVAAEMVSSSRQSVKKSIGIGAQKTQKKSPLQSPTGKKAKEWSGAQAVRAWNNQWSPIKGLNA